MSALVNAGQPFLSRDPADVGLTRSRLTALRREGRVRCVLRGVLVDARVPETRELRARALALVRPDGAVFYGETVAWLHGLDVFRPGDRHDLVPRCVVPHHAGRPRRAGVVAHEGYLPARDVEVVDGLAVTTPLRTVVDLLRALWRPHALAAADAFAHAGLVDPHEIPAALDLLRGFPWIRQARSLCPLVDARVESAGESRTRLRLVDAGLPWPEPQIVLLDRAGVEIARLDMGYRDARLAIEYDGRADHSAGDDQDHDARRRREIAERWGWTVVVVRAEDVWGDGRLFEAEVAEHLGLEASPRTW